VIVTSPKGFALRKLHLLLPSAFLVLVFALTACGGGESDEDKITETIEVSATSTKPADCKRLSTQAFMEQTQFTEGPEAVKGCEEDAKDEDESETESVDVSNVEVEDLKATADGTFHGGTFDGQTLSIALVEEKGNWKVDQITSFAKFDEDKLAQSLEESFSSGEGALDPKATACMGDELRKLSQPEFENLILGGKPEPIVEIVEACE
jgi:hypothetical protein